MNYLEAITIDTDRQTPGVISIRSTFYCVQVDTYGNEVYSCNTRETPLLCADSLLPISVANFKRLQAKAHKVQSQRWEINDC